MPRYPEGTLLTLTRQDVLTFVVGLVAALLWTVGEALAPLATEGAAQGIDWGTWWSSLGVAMAGAAGRYLLTELTQRGFRNTVPPAPAPAPAPDPEPKSGIDEESLNRADLMKTLVPRESVSVIKS